VDARDVDWQDRAHFAISAQMMRRILVTLSRAAFSETKALPAKCRWRKDDDYCRARPEFVALMTLCVPRGARPKEEPDFELRFLAG
jgi:hypothetical protein